MVRLKDIARACGVSPATVSRALNGIPCISKEQAELICRTAKEMGYYPNAAARTLKTSRSSNIGILYEDRLDHEYFSSLLTALRREAENRGYDLTIISRDDSGDAEHYYEHARKRNLDGVIVIQADFDSAGVIRLATSAIPAVIIDHMYSGCDCVGSDNRASVEQLVRYAFSLGHRRIAFISGQQGAVGRERLAGYGVMKSLQGQPNIVTCSEIRQYAKKDGPGFDAYIRRFKKVLAAEKTLSDSAE